MKNQNLDQVIEKLEAKLENASPAEAVALTEKLISLYDRIPQDERLWGISQAAEYLDLAVDTLRKYCACQKIPHLKVNGAVRFAPASLKAWVLSQEIKQHKSWR